MDPTIATDPRLSRLPIPNILRSPGLELFRKYHYPDGYALSCFKPETAEALKTISQVMVEPKPNALEWKPKPTDDGNNPKGPAEGTTPGGICGTAEQAINRLE